MKLNFNLKFAEFHIVNLVNSARDKTYRKTSNALDSKRIWHLRPNLGPMHYLRDLQIFF